MSHCPERFTEADLLARLQIKGEILWGFKQQDDGGAQVELAQVLSFPHGNAFSVVVCYVAEVIVGSFVVARVVGAQLLKIKKIHNHFLISNQIFPGCLSSM